MDFNTQVAPKIKEARGLIRRELWKSGRSGKEYWMGFEPTEEIIDDLIQESLMEAWKQWPVEIKESLSTWVGWIVRGRVLNWKKWHSRRPQVSTTDYTEFSNIEQPDTEIEKEEAFKSLNSREKVLVDLRLGGMTNTEIATVFDCTEGHIKNQFSEIKSKLDEYGRSQEDRPQSRNQ